VPLEGFRAEVKRLAENIKARRLEVDLSQEDVAFDAGLSARHYQQLESGAANPTYQSRLRECSVSRCRTSLAPSAGSGISDAERREKETRKEIDAAKRWYLENPLTGREP
jgi:transcriptional regulator with XRE-family HTH domain